MKPKFTAFALVFVAFSIKSQNIYQQAYWLRLYGRVKFNDNWTVHLETDYRRFTNPDRMWQNYNQLHAHYRFHKNWETVAAVGFAQVWQNTFFVPEWRPYQDIQYFQSLGKGWQLAYRARVEERFIHHSSKTELTEGYGFNIRPRVRVQVSKSFKNNWITRLSEEYFYQNGFNQIQTWLLVEKQLKNNFFIEIGYLKAFVKRSPSGYINRDNIRVSLIKNFTI